MMMEETDEGSTGGDSSEAPSFAMPPGGMNDDASSALSADNSTQTPAPADPFDLLSMTGAAPPVPANNNSNTAPVLDVFGSAPAAPASDFWGGTTTPAIDVSAQNSMIIPGQPQQKPQLTTAESGDLLGLDGSSTKVPPTSHSPPPRDLMDSSFQQLPVEPPITETADPFGGATDVFVQQPPAAAAETIMSSPQPTTKQQNNGNDNFPNPLATPHPVVVEAPGKASTTTNTNSINSNEQAPPETAGEQKLESSQRGEDANNPSENETDDSAKKETKAPPKEDTLTAATPESDSLANNVPAAKQEASKPPETSDDDVQSKPADDQAGTPEPPAPSTPSKKGKPPSPPKSPVPSGDDIMDESVMFEEVELASPATTPKEKDSATNEAAVATESIKPPPFTVDNNTDDAPAQDLPDVPPTTTATAGNDEQQAKIKELEEKLANSQRQVAKVKALEAKLGVLAEQAAKIKDLESNLAQAEARAGSLTAQKEHSEKQHKDRQEKADVALKELQNKLQKEQTLRAEAEHKSKKASEEIQTLRKLATEKEEQWKLQGDAWREQLGGLEKENEALIDKAKRELEDRKEHERRERVLANKLNMLKKQQASTTDVEEVYADDLRLLKDDVDAKTKRIAELEVSETSLKEQLEKEKALANTRIDQLEKAVREEKYLNEERKKKMKTFIEAKTEELKEAKSESESYQAELERNNQSQVDLNNRWKTLHAQWVQSQTRNRELQRDLNKVKKEYENRHKLEDSLNVKLSKSANETEQHKNKRLAAKQELMSVLAKLEAEREITNKLRDSVRFTFTAKAQSQHQLLQEALTEFNKQLESLARRLGRPIPLTSDGGPQSLSSLVMSAVDESERSEGSLDGKAAANGTNGGHDGGPSKEQKRILAETTRLLAKLENETQRISQGIMALTNGIEQMNTLILGGGEKTCFTSIGDIFFGGGLAKAADQGRSARTPVRYGHSSHLPTESGTMT